MRKTIAVALVCLVLGFLAARWWQGRAAQASVVQPPDASTRQEQPARVASLAEQKMCDEQARKKFHEDNPHPREFENYTSHYDAKANICYIRVDSTTADKNSVTTATTIYDAFEGRGYASYIWINNQGKKYWEVKPMQCFVQPIGKDKISCSSEEEFNKLAETHFGIAE